jgi:hypothetical protein
VVCVLGAPRSPTAPGPAVPGWAYGAVAGVTVLAGLDYLRSGYGQLRSMKA